MGMEKPQLGSSQQIVTVLDIEATCWNDGSHKRSEMETIEIGAVQIAYDMSLQDSFQAYIKPVVHPKLSDFCVKLTHITQQQVDNARPFSAVFAEFMQWAEHSEQVVCWGRFDINQLEQDRIRHEITSHTWLPSRHFNLREPAESCLGVPFPCIFVATCTVTALHSSNLLRCLIIL